MVGQVYLRVLTERECDHLIDSINQGLENGGSGLGMSIMAAVIAKLGGEFTLQKSDLGGVAVIATFQRS